MLLAWRSGEETDRCFGPQDDAGTDLAKGAVEAAPHKMAAYRMLELRHEGMAAQAHDLIGRTCELAGFVDAETRQAMQDRLQFAYEQIVRSRINLTADYRRKPDGV